MTERKAAAIALLVALITTACDSTAPERNGPRSIAGTWEVTEASRTPPNERIGPDFETHLTADRAWVRFDEDGHVLVLTERGIGFRGEHTGTYALQGTLDVDGSTYTLTLHGSGMTISSDTFHGRLERSRTMPEREDWIASTGTDRVISTPEQARGDIAWHAGELWVSGGTPQADVIRVDGTSLLVDDLLDPDSLAPTSLAFHGEDLWVGAPTSAFVFRLNTSTVDLDAQSLGVARGITGLASDGALLWCVSALTDRVYLYDPTRNAVVDRIELGENVDTAGAAYVDGSLYIACAGVVTEFAVSLDGTRRLLTPVGAFRFLDSMILGVTHDGDAFWINVQHPSGSLTLRRLGPPR